MAGPRWADLLQRLKYRGGKRLRVLNLTRGGRSPEFTALYQTLLDMWSANLPKGLLDQYSMRNRQLILKVITTQLFLSQVGVMFVPEKLVAQELLESEEAVLDQPSLTRLPTPFR